MKKWLSIFGILLFCVIIAACGGKTPEEQQVDTAATSAAETELAQEALPSSTFTPIPPPTDTPVPPTATPTATPPPTRTATPGPLRYEDDFSSDTGNWLDCDNCEIENGVFTMGPFPASGAYIQHSAICKPCGMVENYRMSVDANYVEGPSERGFGFLLKWTNDYLLTLEVTPWQTVMVWKADFKKQEWVKISGTTSGVVNTGTQVNRIEVEFVSTGVGQSDINIIVNGKTVLVLFGQPVELSPIGLTLYGHALEVVFDNFEFEEIE